MQHNDHVLLYRALQADAHVWAYRLPKRRRIRRGAKRHFDRWHAGRPTTFGRRYPDPDTLDDGIDTTPSPPTTPESFYRSVYFAMLARDPLLVAGARHPDDDCQ
jgi:hypothetical protein